MAYVRDGILHDDWGIADVKSLDRRMNKKDCVKVLELVAENHDAEVGINWDVIQIHIDTVNGRKKKVRKQESLQGS